MTRVRKVVLGLALPGSIGGDEAGIVGEGEKGCARAGPTWQHWW